MLIKYKSCDGESIIEEEIEKIEFYDNEIQCTRAGSEEAFVFSDTKNICWVKDVNIKLARNMTKFKTMLEELLQEEIFKVNTVDTIKVLQNILDGREDWDKC